MNHHLWLLLLVILEENSKQSSSMKYYDICFIIVYLRIHIMYIFHLKQFRREMSYSSGYFKLFCLFQFIIAMCTVPYSALVWLVY